LLNKCFNLLIEVFSDLKLKTNGNSGNIDCEFILDIF